MNYRPEIDGLRAVAILPVILFHAGFGMFSGGFVGVDVFFVISGYLITTVILTEQQNGTFSLLSFYERRIRRILPALFFVMLVCLPFAWWWMLPADMENFSRSLIAVPTFTSNILFRHQSGYFHTSSHLKPLLHTWSLAVEEQYYVFFPLFMLLAWRFGKKSMIAILSIAALVSLVIAERKVGMRPIDAFYLLLPRGWELLMGALAAFYLIQQPKRYPTVEPWSMHALGLLGLALIAYAIVAFDAKTAFPGLHAVIPTLGAVLIVLYATPSTAAGKLLATKPMVGVGLISYSAYLWHQPIFAFARLKSGASLSSPLLISLSAVALLFATFTWKYVERPFRNRAFLTRRTIFISAFAVSLAFIGLGVLGKKTHGYEEYFIAHRLPADEQETYQLIRAHTGGDMYKEMGDNGDCNFWSKMVTPSFTERFETCAKKYGRAVVVLGDSHAMNIYNALFRVNAAPFLVSISQGSCRPHNNAPTCHYDGFDRFLNENANHIERIIYNQSGYHLLHDEHGTVDGINFLAEGTAYGVDQENIEKTALYLSQLSQKTKVIWLGPFVDARFDFHDPHQITRDGFKINERNIAIFNELDRELARMLRSSPHPFTYVSSLKLLHITPSFLKQGDCITYRDSDHFSVCGEKIAGEKLKRTLLQRSK